MIFEEIPTVPTAEELLDKAFRRATRAKRGKQIFDRKTKLQAEESMLLTAANILNDNLAHVVRKFPSFDQMPPFIWSLRRYWLGLRR